MYKDRRSLEMSISEGFVQEDQFRDLKCEKKDWMEEFLVEEVYDGGGLHTLDPSTDLSGDRLVVDPR